MSDSDTLKSLNTKNQQKENKFDLPDPLSPTIVLDEKFLRQME